MLEECAKVLRDGTSTWQETMNARIGRTWRDRRPETVWLDDKVAQIRTTTEFCGKQFHLPLYAHAVAGDVESEAALKLAVLERVASGESFVVKPRHGANSRFVFLWPAPHENPAAVIASVDEVLTGTDKSWQRECWQLSQVPKGAILQPLYSMAVAGEGPKSRPAPLELKVQVLFGETVGATLNTHPQTLWITRLGHVILWDLLDLKRRGHTRCRKLDRCFGPNLQPEALETLKDVLCQDWRTIQHTSEELCRRAGLDELRVDWLVGDFRWGSRIGELTYMGAGGRLPAPVSRRLACAYAGAHLCNAGLLPEREAQRLFRFADSVPST